MLTNLLCYQLQKFRDALESYTKSSTKILCIIAKVLLGFFSSQSQRNIYSKYQFWFSVKSKKVQLIIQIEICLDKSFSLIDCEGSSRRVSGHPKYQRLRRGSDNTKWDGLPYNPEYVECSEDVPVLYLPITTDKLSL